MVAGSRESAASRLISLLAFFGTECRDNTLPENSIIQQRMGGSLHARQVAKMMDGTSEFVVCEWFHRAVVCCPAVFSETQSTRGASAAFAALISSFASVPFRSSFVSPLNPT